MATYIHIIFKCTGMFTKIEHILGHRMSLIKYKRIQIIQSMFFDHNGIKLEINNKRLFGKDIWKLNTTLLNNSMDQGRNQKRSLKIIKVDKMKI